VADRAIILLAEDREEDIILVQRAFKQAYINNPLYVVRNGEEAIDYLSGVGKYSNREEYPVPDLLLLDLKMPRVDGFEVLQWVRAQPGLSTLRIVVLTMSEDMRDVNRAYRLGANSFLVKPMEFQDVMELGKSLTQYWLQLSKAPEIHREDIKKQQGTGDTVTGK
jgi:CheY-like chemotaxis protein